MVKFKDECLEAGIVVHLRTQEQCDEFSKWLDNKGMNWYTGGRYTDESRWYFYKEDTCYYPHDESYSTTSNYMRRAYKILSYEEALLEDYSLPVIDPSKCKDYYVKESSYFGSMYTVVRKGLFIHNGELYCYNENDPTMSLRSYTDFKEVKCTEESPKELTIEEIQKELGYKIKIVEK